MKREQRGSTQHQKTCLTALLAEAPQHGMSPPTNPKKVARLLVAYDVVGIAAMTPDRRQRAADACKSLKVPGVGPWLAECLLPGVGAAAAAEINRQRQAAQVARLQDSGTGASNTGLRPVQAAKKLSGSPTPIAQDSRRSPTAKAGTKSTSSRRRPPEAQRSLAWLPDNETPSPGPGRVATGDGPRTRPRLGIARSSF
jgi:hypothetical protein